MKEKNDTQVLQYTGGGKRDSHVLFLSHLDGSSVDEISGRNMQIQKGGSCAPIFSQNGKFGQCITSICSSGDLATAYILNTPNVTYSNTKQITIEFWFKCNKSIRYSNSSVRIGYNTSSQYAQLGLNVNYSGYFIILNYKNGNWESIVNLYKTQLDGLWHHVALVCNNNLIFVYLDGSKKISLTRSVSLSMPGNYTCIMINGDDCIDEVRVSDIVRYEGNFTPPDKPFA